MPPADLIVPFRDKEAAKRFGARWDAGRKTWILPDGVDASACAKWLPKPPVFNVRSASYFIAQAYRICWRCGRETRLHSFVLAPGHQVWRDDEEFTGWESSESAAVAYYITRMHVSAQAQMQSATHHYRLDFSKTMRLIYWMNHCEHCHTKHGDFELFEEFDTPFCPIDAIGASRILLRTVPQPFEASAATITYESEVFERMRICSRR